MKFHNQFMKFRINAMSAENSSGGSGSSGSENGNPSANELAEAQLEIQRLRSHSTKLLDEKKGLQTKLTEAAELQRLAETFGGLEAMQEMSKQFVDGSEAKLIAEGKIDEVIQKRTERILAKSSDELAEVKSGFEELDTKYKSLLNKHSSMVLEDSLSKAALEAGVDPNALPDALNRAKSVFSLADDGVVEARNSENELVKVEDKILTPALFFAGLKETAGHLWPASQSGNATGSATTTPSELDTEIQKAADKGDMKLYRSLRAKKKRAN